MATCRNGRVSNAVEFVHSSSSKRNYSRDDKSMDMYDVYDYDDPEDFYYDHVDELMIYRMQRITGKRTDDISIGRIKIRRVLCK